MSDVSPYGITQHADADLMTANALVGERVSPVVGNAVHGSAAMFSTAPYIPPRPKAPPPLLGPRHPDRIGKCLGKDDTCRAGPMRGTDWCVFHTQGNGPSALLKRTDW